MGLFLTAGIFSRQVTTRQGANTPLQVWPELIQMVSGVGKRHSAQLNQIIQASAEMSLIFSNTQLSNSLTKLNPLKNSHFVLAVAVPRGRRVTTSWGPLIISGIKLSKTSTSRWPHAIAELPWATYWNFPLLLPCVSLTLPWSKHWGWQNDWDWGEEYEVVSDSLQQWKIIIWAILLNQVYETNPLFFLPLRAVLIKNFIKRKSSHKWAHMTRANHKQFTALIVI